MHAALAGVSLLASLAAVPQPTARGPLDDDPALRAGARVRLHTTQALQVGSSGELTKVVAARLIALDADTVSVELGGRRPLVLPRSAVKQLDVSLGRVSRGDGVLRRGGQGVLIGGLAGALFGLLSGDDRCPEGGCWFGLRAEQKALVLGIMGGVAGGAIGGLSGAISPPERWRRVDVPRARVTVRPVRGGAGAQVALSF